MLSAKIGGTTYSVSGNGFYLGSLAGERYAAIMLGEGMTVILERDYASTAKTMKVISVNGADLEESKVKEIHADLLPAPEPPDEVKAALAYLQGIKGWKAVADNKGNISLVPDDVVAEKRTRAPNGSVEKRIPKPTIAKGLVVTRKKDGLKYRVSSIDAATGYVIFKPLEGHGDDFRTKALKGSGSLQVVPVFWANWAEVQ